MKIRRDNRPRPAPALKTAIGLGLYREIPRHELHSGSWQQEMYDRRGRRFYESTDKPEPVGRALNVHEAAVEAAENGRTVMVFVQACNDSIPYDEYVAMLESGFRATGHPDPDKRQNGEIYKTDAQRMREEQRESEVAEAAGSIAIAQAAEAEIPAARAA